METLPKFGISRADMLKRVARFKELKGSDGGLPDSKAPQCERTLYNVIGFTPTKDSGGAVTSPVGDDASRSSAIPISEGFNLGYCRAKPGKGPMMHNHDTNETFIPILMFVIGGYCPKAEFTDTAMKELEDAGVWPRG